MQVHRAADRIRSAAGSILVAGLVFLAAFLMGTGTARAAQREVSVRIPVACEATGIGEYFQYSLRDSSGDLLLPQLLLQDGQEDWFTLTFTSPGRYTYTVTQEKGTDAKVIYDETRFQAVVYVEETANALNAQLILYRQEGGDKLSKLTFVNQKKENGENGSGGDSTGDDSSNSGSGGGNNNGGGSNGSGSGDSNGSGNGSGGGSDNDGSAGGGAGNGSTNGSGSAGGSGNDNGSGSFWGNGSFWGSTSGSTAGNTNGSGFWGNAFVRTGDGAPLALWLVIALIAIALAAGLLLYKRNYETRTDRKDREDG